MLVDISTIDQASELAKSTYILDTNILIFIHRPQIDKQALAGEYSRFLSVLRDRGCQLIVSTLNLQEALYVIETSCLERYKKSNGYISRKKYRGLTAERQRVRREQKIFFTQIRQFYEITPESISEKDMEDYTDFNLNHQYDPIDYIVSTHHSKIGIISDDIDFSYDTNITVYTKPKMSA